MLTVARALILWTVTRAYKRSVELRYDECGGVMVCVIEQMLDMIPILFRSCRVYHSCADAMASIRSDADACQGYVGEQSIH
jgi:hypothetical protein